MLLFCSAYSQVFDPRIPQYCNSTKCEIRAFLKSGTPKWFIKLQNTSEKKLGGVVSHLILEQPFSCQQAWYCSVPSCSLPCFGLRHLCFNGVFQAIYFTQETWLKLLVLVLFMRHFCGKQFQVLSRAWQMMKWEIWLSKLKAVQYLPVKSQLSAGNKESS